MQQQALGRRLVLAEVPDAPEVRQERREAALRARREAVRPALLGDLRRIALGDRPGARRVHDQRALARHQPLVVGGVVPGRRVGRQERGQLLVVVERLADRVGLDRDLALGVDQLGAEGVEDRAGRVDRCPTSAPRPMPNGMPALWQASAAFRKVSSVQASALGGAPAGYIAWTSMPACCFIRSMREHGPLIWLPIVGRHREPLAVDLAEILDRAR